MKINLLHLLPAFFFCHWSDLTTQAPAAAVPRWGFGSVPDGAWTRWFARRSKTLRQGSGKGFIRGFQVGFRTGIFCVSWVVRLPVFQLISYIIGIDTERIRTDWNWMWWIGSIKVDLYLHLAVTMTKWPLVWCCGSGAKRKIWWQ